MSKLKWTWQVATYPQASFLISGLIAKCPAPPPFPFSPNSGGGVWKAPPSILNKGCMCTSYLLFPFYLHSQRSSPDFTLANTQFYWYDYDSFRKERKWVDWIFQYIYYVCVWRFWQFYNNEKWYALNSKGLNISVSIQSCNKICQENWSSNNYVDKPQKANWPGKEISNCRMTHRVR